MKTLYASVLLFLLLGLFIAPMANAECDEMKKKNIAETTEEKPAEQGQADRVLIRAPAGVISCREVPKAVLDLFDVREQFEADCIKVESTKVETQAKRS